LVQRVTSTIRHGRYILQGKSLYYLCFKILNFILIARNPIELLAHSNSVNKLKIKKDKLKKFNIFSLKTEILIARHDQNAARRVFQTDKMKVRTVTAPRKRR